MIYRFLFAFVLVASLMLSKNIAFAQTVSVMTYNLRLDIPSDGVNAWPNRRKALSQQVAWLAPDVMGVQEALPQQLSYLRENLSGYDFVGIGRKAALGDEATAIFYDRNRFEVLTSNTFWLSETPAEVSMGWGASYPRIATYVHLRDRNSGEELFAFNAHLDHKAQEARVNGIALISSVIDSLVPVGVPVILMGDFNATPENEAILQLKSKYTDSYEAVNGPRLGPAATFSGFDASKSFNRRIDYIFFRNSNNVNVKRFATIATTQNGKYLSDHLPVIAEIEFSRKPIIIGHRGARGHATENSLASIQVALGYKAEMIEIDVFKIADGEIIVFHDKKLERLTDGTGKIEELTLSEINQLTLAGAHKIPRLKDVLVLMQHRARLNVELKGANTAEGTYEILKDFVNNHGYKWEDFAISSFRHDELRRMRALHPTIEIGILPHGNTQKAIAVAQEVGATSINPFHGKLSQEDVDAAHRAGFLVYPYTVNELIDIARMIDIGVDGLITDFPDRVNRANQN